MRNLKRALSLTLASVMLLGMMVVGSSAAAGYDDVKETDNVEAIEVLQAVEVMVGDDRGFGPDRPVNRAEMAVVMGKLLNLDYNYYVSTCPFTDVSGNYDWAKGWVGACAANGIVSGRGNGIYDPGATVTAVEAASMMMRALGYFQYTEDYADGFNVVTVRQGSQIGIFNGVGTDANTPMTRNQVAQMALNALESEMVTFTGTPGVSVNGVNVGYRAEYTPRTSTQTKYQAIERRTSDVSGGNNLNRGQYYIQLGEELYDGKLTKKYDTDDFERPSINWQYNGKEIGVYVDYDLLVAGGTFTTPVKYSELYNLLTFTTINDNDLYRYVDGVDQKESKENFARSNKDEVGGQGVLTEVFYNQDREEIIVTSINTYLAKANSDYNSTNETLSLKVFETNGTGTTKIVDSEDVDEAADVAKDEFRLVYMSGKDNAANKLEVVRIFDAPIMTDTQITKWSKHDTKVVDKLTTDGTEYKTNPKAYYDKNGDVLLAYNEQRLTDTSYNIFMDRYDNVIGVDLYEGTKNYVFITGYDRINSNISVKTADAAAIFMDGTMEVITVNVTDTDKNIRNTKANAANYVEWSHYSREGCRDLNRWYTYTTAANGNYTLKPVERSFYTSYNSISDFDTKGVKVLNTANLYLNDARPTNGTVYTNQGRIYGNDDSVYITVEPGYVDTSTPTASHDAITDVQGVYTGAQDVKLEISTTSKELVNERKGENHDTSVYPDDSVDYSKVDYGEVDNPSEQNAYVYSVYDSNYYIIASVVLGDAQGAAANYAYILGDAKSEWVEHGDKDDTYYWEFEAVLNGEKQTLTVKSKYEDTIDDLRPYHVQELRFDGEYVTAIKEVDNDKVMKTNNDTSLKTDDFDVYDVGHTTARVATDAWADSQNIHTDANGTTHNGRYEYDFSDHRIDGTIELVGRTLYTERPHDVGLALTSDAKAVLIQKENKSVETTQCDSVAEAIGRLADADTRDVPAADGIQFHGRIVAVLDSAGAAKWVVIISDTLLLTGNRPGYGENDDIWMELIEGTATEGHYWKLHVPYSRDIYSARPSSEEIAGWLADAGCTEISKDREGWNFVRRGVTHTNQAVEVVWCGYDHFHEEDTYSVTVSPAAAGEVDARSYKVGDIVTVTAKPGENQTVKSVTTSNGDTVTKINETTYTFRMPAKNVIVYVTFEDKESEDKEVTVKIGAGLDDTNCEISVGGKVVADGDKVKTGEVLTIKPDMMIAVVTGVDENGKVTGDVTIEKSPYFNWIEAGHFWMGSDEDGNLLTFPFAKAAQAKARSLARAANFNPIEWEEGTTATMDLATWGALMLDKGATYTITSTFDGVDYTWTATIPETGAIKWVLNKTTGTDVDGARKAAALILSGSATVTKDKAAEPVEPSEVDARTLPVQASSDGGHNAKVNFSVYFDGSGRKKVTEQQIFDAMNATTNLKVKSVKDIDIKNRTATLASGATVTWDETVINKDGYAIAPGATTLYKVTILGKDFYMADGTYDGADEAHAQLPVAGEDVKFLLKKEETTAADGDQVTVEEGLADEIEVDGADLEYVQAYPALFNIGSDYTPSLCVSSSDLKNVYYRPCAKGADGVVSDDWMKAKAADTDFYIQKGTVISFETKKADGTDLDTNTCEKNQVLTVKVNGVETKYNVTADGEAPKVGEITVSGVESTNDPDTDGRFNLVFELSKTPDAANVEKHVFLNNKELTNVKVTEDADGVENGRVYSFTSAEFPELAKGAVVLPAEAQNGDLKKIKTAVTEVGKGTGNWTYSWDYTNADRVPSLHADDPQYVYLYTAWPVTVGSNINVYTKFDTKYDAVDANTQLADDKGWTSTTDDTGSTKYFIKTAGGMITSLDDVKITGTTIYLKAKTAGDQLWWADDETVEGLKPVSKKGTGAGVGLLDKPDDPAGDVVQGIWELKVDRAIVVEDEIEAAYNVNKDSTDDTAEITKPSEPWTWGEDGATTITVTLNKGGATAKVVTPNIVTSVKFNKGAGDKNDWECYWDGDDLKIYAKGKIDGVNKVDYDSALTGGPSLDITFVGGYTITGIKLTVS